MEACPKHCICPVSPCIPELIQRTQGLIENRLNTAGQQNSLSKFNLELLYQEVRCSSGDLLSYRGIRKLLFELIVTGGTRTPF